ncbi:MAG: alpha/beta fold hydrolase [Myxococcota bacterium]
MTRLGLLCLSALLFHCGDDAAPSDSAPEVADSSGDEGAADGEADGARDERLADSAGDGPTDCIASAEVVRFETSDGVELEADRYEPSTPSGLGVVLLHMIPPSNDRSNYPAAFIDALSERCALVLNVDRRGAGGSAGSARDAYTGDSGVLDAVAAVAHLRERGAERIAIVGASNGTTTLLDYVASDAPDPVAAVFLSGGTYTENQHPLSSLGAVPALFLYPPGEASWNERDGNGRDTRTFESVSPGAHGTRLFTSNPETVERVATFVTGF